MKCFKCSKKSLVKTEDKHFCNNCFSEVIEKRVRKELREQGVLSINIRCKENKMQKEIYLRNIKILILDDESEKSSLNKYFLKKIINDRRAVFKIKKISMFDVSKDYDSKKEFDKIVIPWCLDDETVNYIKKMFKKDVTKEKSDERIIKPLISITLTDTLIFTKINKIYFKNKTSDKDEISLMIDKMNKKYPGTKFSILKTIKNMK